MVDVVDWIRTVTRRCRFVASPDQALRLVPDLAVDAPPFVHLPQAGPGAPDVAIPVACTEVLANPVVAALTAAFDRALERSDREAVADLPPEAWRRDPLAPALARLLLEATLVSPRATGIAVLETFRLSSIMASTGRTPAGVHASDTRERLRVLEKQVSRLQALPWRRRGEVLQAVSWSMSARIGAAWLLAGRVDPTVRPTRFHQGCLRSRLALVLPAGVDSAQMAPDLLPGFLDLPLEEATLRRILDLVSSVLLEMEGRAARDALTGADVALRAALPLESLAGLPPEDRACVLSRSPEGVAVVLSRLASFRAAKDLTGLLPPEVASRLLDPGASRALIVSVIDVTTAMQRWDLVATLASLALPAEGLATSDVPSPRLLVPRGGQPVAGQAVLAVRLADLRARATEAAVRDLEPLVEQATESTWRRVVQLARERGALVQDLPTHALFVLPTASAALDVAHEARTLVSGRLPLPMDPIRTAGGLVGLPAPAVGLAYGAVSGGSDGATTAIGGEPVTEAVRLCGSGPLEGRESDLLGFRAVWTAPGVLRSESIVASPAFVDALRAEAERGGNPFLPVAQDPWPAGIREPFHTLPIEGVREEGEQMITVLVGVGTADRAMELRLMPIEELADLHRRDQDASLATPPTTFEEVFQSEPEPSQDLAIPADEAPDTELLLEAEEAGGFDLEAEEPSEEIESEAPVAPPPAATPARSAPRERADLPEPARAAVLIAGEAPRIPEPPPDDEPILGFLPPAGDDDAHARSAEPPPPVRSRPPAGGARNPVAKAPEVPMADAVPATPLARPRTAPPPTLRTPTDPGENDVALDDDDDEPFDMDLPEVDEEPPRAARASVPPVGAPPARASLPPHESHPPADPGPAPEPPARVPPPVGPRAAAGAPRARQAEREAARRAVAPDFKFLFKGYRVWVLGDGTVVFGQRYGSHLLDVHQYHVEGDADQAYRRFLADKISERFVPHTERSQVVPATSAGDSLDWELLTESFVRINS